MPTHERVSRLLGRRSECAALDQLLASVRAGPSRALVLRGEAGVGKSALLEIGSSSSPAHNAPRSARRSTCRTAPPRIASSWGSRS